MFDECSDTTARHRPDQQPQEEGGRRSPSVVWPALRSGLRPSLQPGQTTDPTGHHSCRSTGHRSCRRALSKKFFLNLDLKYIDMKAKAKLNGVGIGKMDLNPLVFGIGFGTRF